MDNVIAMCELYGVTADYILRGQEMKQENPSAGQNNKNRTTVFGILTGAGAILLCLLPLFARLYQTMEMRTWNQANTFAARYLVEFPLLGILLMALGLLAAGLAGMIRIRCMGRHES